MAEYNDTHKNTYLPVTVADRRVDGECSGDYILPDTVADIKRVLRVTPDIIPGPWYCDGDTLAFEGRAVYTALIVTDEDKLVRLRYEEEYSDSVSVAGLSDDMLINIRPEVGALVWRIVNQRKLGIRLKLSTHISVSEKRDISPVLDGFSADKAELQYDEVTLPSVCMYYASESGRLCEDVELEGTLPPMADIIDCRCEMSVSECKCGDGSVSCRGEAMVSVMYMSDAGEPVFTVRQLPFMQSVAFDAARPDSQALAYVRCESPSFEIKANGYGEMRVIALDLDYTVTAECASDTPVTLLRDVYSIRRPITTVPHDVTLTRLERGYTTNFSVNASAQRSEIGALEAQRAVDTDVRAVITEFRYDRERSKLMLEGSADICAACVRKDEGGANEYSSHTFSCPIKCELDASFGALASADDMRFRCVCNVVMVRTRLDDSALYCDFEVALSLFAIRDQLVSTIGSAVCDGEDVGNARDGASILLCYPSPTETLWDIAKRCRTTCENISELNGFSDAERSPQFTVHKKYHVLMV